MGTAARQHVLETSTWSRRIADRAVGLLGSPELRPYAILVHAVGGQGHAFGLTNFFDQQNVGPCLAVRDHERHCAEHQRQNHPCHVTASL